jgi:broad specificity phosphatase PhoE
MLILVRHGRTEANAAGLLLGRLDPALDEVGRAQALAVAEAIATGSEQIARVVSSPLGRTRETAAAIAEATGLVVEVDERWIELDYGEFDGVPLGDIPREVWGSWQQDATFRPPGGESLVDLGLRVQAGLTDLARQVQEEHVVVVSHVSPIKAAVAWTLGVGDAIAWRMFLAPASITRVAITDRGPSLHGFNLTAHLASG